MHPGKVIIAGAGPGDPELLTLKALRYLRIADVVLTDRLVSEEILNLYVNPRAEIIYVGKEGHSGNSISQEKINWLLVENALRNKLVVRLKGGDVAIYSNVLDELETLVEYNIAYEIVPGITAASGASAYSGIPLTARGFANSVRYLTSNSEPKTEEYWRELATTDDTLVLYMAGSRIDDFVEQLAAHDVGDKAIAVIEQATTPLQRVIIHSFDGFRTRKNITYTSPTVIIIGKVVHLHQHFAWRENVAPGNTYFRDANRRNIENDLLPINIL